MRLFKFMSFFSLDLNTYNLNISRIRLTNALLLLKWSYCLWIQESPKWQPVVLNLVILKDFGRTGLSPPINI